MHKKQSNQCKKLYQRFHRLYSLGIHKIIQQIYLRSKKKFFSWHWRRRMLVKKAGYQWPEIAHKNNIANDFSVFWQQIKDDDLLEAIFQCSAFQKSLPQTYRAKETVLKNAQQAASRCFDLLGSGPVCFQKNTIPWHADFKAESKKITRETLPLWHQPGNTKKDLPFYTDIDIAYPLQMQLDQYYPDIKVPWELSRLQHLFFLGSAYRLTHDATYAEAFYEQIDDWITQNPFLYGVNWVCPMEIAIRSINLIWSIYFFKDASCIPSSFWQRLVCSLYDHAQYLESNWEKTTNPHNHYLVNLIGYFYLARFFKSIPRFKKRLPWCYHELRNEWNRQVLPDGTSFEGSTSYHRLATETFFHFYLLCTKDASNTFSLPPSFLKKLQRMWKFLDACSDHRHTLVQIGDNDSGKILCSITALSPFRDTPPAKKTLAQHFPNFGLSVIKNQKWHITLRHPTFAPGQPTGHFHHDQLSFTVSINGIPIFVDPGSYVYTAHPAWRNLMRSRTMHSSFFLEQETAPGRLHQNGDDLFQLTRKPHAPTKPVAVHGSKISMHAYDNAFEPIGLVPHRKLQFFSDEATILITDWWQRTNAHAPKNTKSIWTFHLHPEIIAYQEEVGMWILRYHKKRTFGLYTNLNFQKTESFFSPSYGNLEKSTQLRAEKLIEINKHHAKKASIKIHAV